MTTLYRATTSGYEGVGSHWSTSRADAEAYTAAGVGRGGGTVIARRVSPDDIVLRVSSSVELAREVVAAMNADELTRLERELGGGVIEDVVRGMYPFQVLEGDAAAVLGRRSVMYDVPSILARVADWVVFSEPRVGDAMLVCETWRRLDDRHELLPA